MTRMRIHPAETPSLRILVGLAFVLISFGGFFVIGDPLQSLEAGFMILPLAAFIAIGIAVLGSGIRAQARLNRLRRSGIRTEGVITDLIETPPDEDGDVNYIARYEYKDRRGRTHRGESPPLFQLDASRWRLEDRVTIVYDGSAPDISAWSGERPQRPTQVRQPPASKGRKSARGDLFEYDIAGKAMVMVLAAVGVGFILLPVVLGTAWFFIVFGLLGIAAQFSYPTGVEVGDGFVRVHYLFGRPRTYARDELALDLHSTTLIGRPRTATSVGRVLGSFHFLTHLAAGGDQLLRKLGFDI